MARTIPWLIPERVAQAAALHSLGEFSGDQPPTQPPTQQAEEHPDIDEDLEDLDEDPEDIPSSPEWVWNLPGVQARYDKQKAQHTLTAAATSSSPSPRRYPEAEPTEVIDLTGDSDGTDDFEVRRTPPNAGDRRAKAEAAALAGIRAPVQVEQHSHSAEDPPLDFSWQSSQTTSGSFQEQPMRTPTKSAPTTYEERLQVKALYFYGKMEPKAIADALGLTVRQVRYAIMVSVKPGFGRCGRVPTVPNEVRQLIHTFVNTPNKTKRALPYAELRRLIPAIQPYGAKSIQSAMEDNGTRRILQPIRQPLTAKARQARLQFALQWAGLLPGDWDRWIWTDETWVNGLGAGRRFITLFAGEDPQDFAHFRMRANGWMFWGCFAGKIKGPGLVWDKKWGKINSETYQARILPLLKAFWAEHQSFVIQQDNAPAHNSKSTRAWMEQNFPDAHIVDWPPHSPDLNPIEHVWVWMKRWIERQYPVRPTGNVLREAVLLAWAAVPSEYLCKLVESMPKRLAAVIAANGGYTGY